MKLSIIVPVYNMVAGGKLRYCLESLVNQNLEDYEIVAVDDKSTDKSLDILHEYKRKYPEKVKVIESPENRRQGGAKNLGLEVATGEWIGFLDSDDWASSDMYRKLLHKAELTGADIVGCDYLKTPEIGLEEGVAVENNTQEQCGILTEEQYRKLIIKPGSMVVKIYKRSIFEDNHIRFPEKMFYEDNAIGVLPLLHAKHFERVKETLYFYYQHSASTVHSMSLEKASDRVKAMEIYLEECRKRGFYSLYKDEIDYKIFELGYCNTLFGYMQGERRPNYAFIVMLQHFLNEHIPNYTDNPYYKQYNDEEAKKMIKLHQRNARVFILYYKMLNIYRQVRYGKRR